METGYEAGFTAVLDIDWAATMTDKKQLAH
jgi:hypothetical protein